MGKLKAEIGKLENATFQLSAFQISTSTAHRLASFNPVFFNYRTDPANDPDLKRMPGNKPARPPRKPKTPPEVQAAWIAGLFGLAAVFLTFLLTGRDQPIKMAEKSGGGEVSNTFATQPSQPLEDLNPPKDKPAVESPTLTGGNPGNRAITEEPEPTASPGPSEIRELPGRDRKSVW